MARIASLPAGEAGAVGAEEGVEVERQEALERRAGLVEVLVAAEDLHPLGDEGVAREEPAPLGDVEGELVDGVPRGGDDARRRAGRAATSAGTSRAATGSASPQRTCW